MNLLVEAFPAQAYKFKLIHSDDDVETLGTSWATEFYDTLENYLKQYDINKIIVMGPGTFVRPIANNMKQNGMTSYTQSTEIDVYIPYEGDIDNDPVSY